MTRQLPMLCGVAALLAASAAGAAQPVELRAAIFDDDGKVTLGELFDGAGAAAGVVAATSKPGSGVVLDAGQVQRLASIHGLAWDNAAGVRRIIVRTGGADSPAGPRGSVQALTYTRSLAAGEIVGPQDLAWTKVAAAPLGAPRDADQLIGMAAKRPLREGAAAGLHDVSAPVVIKKDDLIAVSYAADGINLTLQAKALQEAAAGDAFNALNPASKKVIQAVAVAAGRAVVGPQADQARAVDPRLFASLR